MYIFTYHVSHPWLQAAPKLVLAALKCASQLQRAQMVSVGSSAFIALD